MAKQIVIEPRFEQSATFMTFYAIQRSDAMRGPFGFLGPFPGKDEAQSVCDFFNANSSKHTFAVAQCGLADDMTSQEELADEYAKAMAKLTAWKQH
ncbi:hypothetical protein [Pseudomonas sp. BMS12]|uniref:hypothetical protein n=1 Tax=Pseudomonas sp. BMS12 TaxID=1796033 RepID=UPI000839E18D|nr:hypothetical protein [Pseudomonas sp. BMS12]